MEKLREEEKFMNEMSQAQSFAGVETAKSAALEQ
jgi:hypothetical protein